MRRSLVLVAAAVTSMVALAFLVPLALTVRQLARDRAMTEARQTTQALTLVLASGATDLEAAAAGAGARAGGTVSVFMPDGSVLGAPAQPDNLVQRAREGVAFTQEVAGGVAQLTPVLLRDGGLAVIRVLVPGDVLDRGVAASWAVLAGLGVVLIGGSVVVADRLGRSTVRSTGRVAGAARSLAGGDLDARAPVGGPPEVAEVAAALNALADRIRELLAAEREAAADLSHRLRTPMTALRLDVEALGGGPEARRIAQDLDELHRAVDRLIRETRTPGAAGSPAATDLVAVTRERTDFWRPLAEEQGRAWRLDLPARPGAVAAPRQVLEDVLDALLGNVFAHTPEGTGCTVRVTLGDRRVVLVVEDEGPGIDTSGSALERGVSGAGSTGLGLDIVRRAAERHGGSLDVGAAAGGGARISVSFARAEQG